MRQNAYKSKRNMAVILSLFFVAACVMFVTTTTKALDLQTSGYCGADDDGKNVQWSYDTDNNVLTFRGTGAIADYGSGEREWDVYYKKAKKIVVEEGITRVGTGVCESFSNVTELSLPSTLKSIGQTFNGMSNLQELVLPTGLQEIGENSFSEMNSLRELMLPVDLQEIGDYSFTGLYNIRKIDVPGIQTISAGLFTGMGTCAVRLNEGTETVQNGAISISYSTIYMPSTLTTWNDGFKSARYIYGKNETQELFAYKEDIIYIDATQSYNIEGANIEIDGDLYTVQDKNVYLSYKHEGTDVPLNEGFDYTVEFSVDPVSGGAIAVFSGIGCYTGIKTVKLGEYAGYCGDEEYKNAMWMFENGTLTITGIGVINTGLYGNSDSILNKDDIIKVVIEEGIESIGGCSFYGCNNLESVEFPSSLKSIKLNAFVACSSLTEIELPEGLAEMEYGAFERCSSLTSVKIPSSLTVLEDCIFQQCNSLEEVEIPEGITVIKGAFPDCKGLKKVILPDGLTEIDNMK